jgi:protein O-mannosyl-transferase
VGRKGRRGAPAAAGRNPLPTWGVALACALLTALVYGPALRSGFVSWDDPEVLLENLHLRRLDWESLRWMGASFHTGNWIPLTWLSHALVYRAARLDPWAHHAVNVALHAANTALVFLLVQALFQRATRRGLRSLAPSQTPWAAAIAALLFGLHPLHVESVAWVAERKDVLYAFFFLLALRVHLWEPARAEQHRLPAWFTALFFVMALGAKPMAVTLPIALLVLDLWPLGRLPAQFRSALAQKLPLFLLAAAAAWLALLAQASQGAIAARDQVPASFRIMNAFHSLGFYLWKMVLPFNLLPFYPIGRSAPAAFSTANLAAGAFVLGLSGLLLWKGRGQGAPLVAAWSFYVITLAPVLGLVQVGNQLAADRYVYLASLGPFIAVAALLASSRGGIVVAALALFALVPVTREQIRTWRDSVTLWGRVVAAYPDVSAIAHTNLANAYHGVGRNAEAVGEFQRARAIGPVHAYIENGLGTALLDLGETDAAIRAFEAALALEPTYAVAQRNLWFAWNAKGDAGRARAAAEAAVRADPGYAEAWSSLGISQGTAGSLAAAEASFRRALELDPDNVDFLENLAVTYERMGHAREAQQTRSRARRLGPP